MSKNIVILLKSKLMDIDALLPVLFEMKARQPGLVFYFVFYNLQQYNNVRQQYFLWQAITHLNGKTVIARPQGRWQRVRALGGLFLCLLGRRNVLFKSAESLPKHAWFEGILRVLAHTIVIKVHFVPLTVQGNIHMAIQHVLIRERLGKPIENHHFRGYFDFFLTEYPAENFERFSFSKGPKERMLATGYTRSLPVWRHFLDAAIAEAKWLSDKKYCVYFLSCFHKRVDCLDEPKLGDLLKESLLILKEFNAQLLTVFKPHVITDMDAFTKLLAEIKFENYKIDYGHPMLLASQACFTLGNTFSITMNDACLMGAPVVEYSCSDPELFQRIERQSMGARAVDFLIRRDPQRLREVITMLVNQPVRPVRSAAFINENYPSASGGFLQFLDKVVV